MQHGKLLLALHQAPSSLERMLAVAKLCVTLLADLMRRSNDTQDIPLLILGHHYISHRVLSEYRHCIRILQNLQTVCIDAFRVLILTTG
jgi:hypothetical protein